LERDVVNVLNFFSRKFNIETSLDGVMEYITE
jgi:RIO-like serine/threonine protein kinase